jgi:hypothetical protein
LFWTLIPPSVSTQALLRTQTEAEEKRRLHEAAVKDIEDKWATARELEVAQRVKKKRYKNKLADAEKASSHKKLVSLSESQAFGDPLWALFSLCLAWRH